MPATCTGDLVSATISNGREIHYHAGVDCPGHEPAPVRPETVSMRFGRHGSAIHIAYAGANTPRCGAYFRPGAGVVVGDAPTCKRCIADRPGASVSIDDDADLIDHETPRSHVFDAAGGVMA